MPNYKFIASYDHPAHVKPGYIYGVINPDTGLTDVYRVWECGRRGLRLWYEGQYNITSQPIDGNGFTALAHSGFTACHYLTDGGKLTPLAITPYFDGYTCECWPRNECECNQATDPAFEAGVWLSEYDAGMEPVNPISHLQ